MPLYNLMGSDTASESSPSMPETAKPSSTETGGEIKRPVGDEEYYGLNAKLSHYKEKLKTELQKKDPQGFKEFISTYGKIRLEQGEGAAQKFVQESKYDGYLKPDEVKKALGSDYQDYVDTLSRVKDIGFSDDRGKNFVGVLEGSDSIDQLNFGKRFATIPLVTSYATRERTDMYNYNPETKKIDKISKIH